MMIEVQRVQAYIAQPAVGFTPARSAQRSIVLRVNSLPLSEVIDSGDRTPNLWHDYEIAGPDFCPDALLPIAWRNGLPGGGRNHSQQTSCKQSRRASESTGIHTPAMFYALFLDTVVITFICKFKGRHI